MNHWRPFVVAVVAVCLVACSPRDDSGSTSTPDPSNTTTQEVATTATPAGTPSNGASAEFDADRALGHIEALANGIGERVAGTDGESTAASYIGGELRNYGYDVDTIPFEFDGERYGLSHVRTPEQDLTGYHLVGSAGGEVTAPAVYLGLGRAEDYAGKVVASRIAVVDRGDISFNEKYLRAKDTGAVGLVVINDRPGALIFANLDARSTFPVVGVSSDDGESLLTVAESGGELTIQVPNDDIGHSLNVVASAPGTESCDILVGAHHDSVPASPGGNDNASGVSHVLELARVMASDGLDEGLCFATFGAEEHGLFGSADLANAMAEADELPMVMVNLDVTGIGQFVEVIGRQELRERAIAIGLDLGIEVVSSSLPANAGSDHQSFDAVGVDVLFFTSGGFDAIHTPDDMAAPIERDEIERIGRVAQQFLLAEMERIARG